MVGWVRHVSGAALLMGIGIVVAMTYLTASISASVTAARRARVAAVQFGEAERRLVQLRRDLAAMEKAVGDRTAEVADLGDQLREAQALLSLSQTQAAAVKNALGAAMRSRWAWLWWLLNLLVAFALGYLVNWTSDPLGTFFRSLIR